MPQEFWTNYPRMEYWPDYPDRWLLSVNASEMSNRAYGAYHRILCHMKREPLPGVFPLSVEMLMKFGRIKMAEWKADAASILCAFVVFEDGTIHHEFVKAIYRKSCERIYDFYKSGIESRALKASKGKKGATLDPKVLPYLDPYHKWEGQKSWTAHDSAVFNVETGLFIMTSGGLQGAYRVPEVDSCNKERKKESNKLSFNQATTAAAHGEADGVVVDEKSPMEGLGKALKEKLRTSRTEAHP